MASETVVKLLSHLSIDELRARFEDSNSGDHTKVGSLNLSQFLVATQIDDELKNDDEVVKKIKIKKLLLTCNEPTH
jgi:hypothetical protein